MSIEIRDRREANWFWASRDIVYKDGKKIGPYGISVYAALCCHSNEQNKAWPSLSTLADEIGCGERKVREVLRELEALGWIVCDDNFRDDGSQTSNVYTLLPSPHAAPPALQDTAPLASHADKRESVKENQGTSVNSGQLARTYEECFGLLISPFQLQKLVDFSREYTDTWVADALKESALHNKRDLRYAEAILRRWKTEGRPTNGNGAAKPTISKTAKEYK